MSTCGSKCLYIVLGSSVLPGMIGSCTSAPMSLLFARKLSHDRFCCQVRAFGEKAIVPTQHAAHDTHVYNPNRPSCTRNAARCGENTSKRKQTRLHTQRSTLRGRQMHKYKHKCFCFYIAITPFVVPASIRHRFYGLYKAGRKGNV